MQTPQGLWVYKPRTSFSHIYDVAADRRGYFGSTGRVDYNLNNLGLRDKDVYLEKPPGVRRILCLGDSFTFGEGVREEDAWPQRLGRLAGQGTQVINAGVQGYGFEHEALYLLLYRRQLKPDVVVIAFFMNDAIPFEETVSHHALLTETPAELSPLGRFSAAWRLLEQRRIAARKTSRYLSELSSSFSSHAWSESKERMHRLRELADQEGFEIVAMVFPLLYRFDDYPLEREHGEVGRAFAAAGIEVVDLLDAYRSHDAEDLWAHPTDPHPNEVAHALAAEYLARKLRLASTRP